MAYRMGGGGLDEEGDEEHPVVATLLETIARGILTTIISMDWTERMSPTWTREAPISRI